MKASDYHLILSIVCAIASAICVFSVNSDSSIFFFILTVYNGLKSDIYEIEEKLNREEDGTDD